MRMFPAILFCAVGFCTSPLADELGELPSPETREALRSLKIEPRSDLSSAVPTEIKVEPEKLPANKQRILSAGADGKASVPFIIPNTMIIQFSPSADKADMNAFLKEKNARVISTQANLGVVQIETDLSKYFYYKISDNSVNDTYLRGLTSAIEDFKSDPRIVAASPDLVLRDKRTPNLDIATNVKTFLTEQTDWGIADIEADQLWELPGAENGVIFGVMDVGFSPHNDLIFSSLSRDVVADDHGNHVAGIACAKHLNGQGIRGVVPNCFVRPKTGAFYTPEPGGNVLAFLQTFGQILAALNEFIPNKDEVKTFNISLGYNWDSNFGINPDHAAAAQWRQIVAAQGEFFISVLRLAHEKDKVIFTAAGNDSDGLTDPIDAKFASPMNWAAITAAERNIVRNGVVVEAHDKDGNRAPFSNENGMLSCPGVGILSSVAFDASKNPAKDLYAEMSGTSMASPYCAGAHTLFSLVRPMYSGTDVVDCMIRSGVPSNSGTPMLKLERALALCPPRP